VVIIGHLILVTVLCLFDMDLNDFLNFQYVGYRTGYVSLAQIPLIFLLAGKNNIIGAFTGMSYERLNWVHRWISRSLLFTTTLHMGYWFRSWAPYGDYITVELTTNGITMRGFAAWILLVWIVFSSFAPIRGWSYEIFVLQHIITFIGFIVAVYLHLPASAHGWIWAPVAIYCFDRLSRALYAVYINLALFHPKQQTDGTDAKASGMLACQAVLSPLSGNVTRVTIANPPITWQAGQHAYLACQSIMPLQNHPFTITSLPSDGKLEFLVKAQRGGTKRLHAYAQKIHLSLPAPNVATPPQSQSTSVTIEGPYGRIRPLRQFDSVVLFAGATGATFTLPLLRDIVRQWTLQDSLPTSSTGLLTIPDIAATRHIRFVWVVKSRSQLQWFSEQLNQAMADVQALRKQGRDVELDASVYVTCDESLTEDWNASTLQSVPGPAVINKETIVEELDLPAYESRHGITHMLDVKEKIESAGDMAVREIDPRLELSSVSSSSTSQRGVKTCGKDGACCCQTTIKDEAAIDAILPKSVVCHCNCSHDSSSSSSSSIRSGTDTVEIAARRRTLHPAITLLSGRPHPRNILRRSLEQATGESAVVVCGPKGLNNDVRSAVVTLSDERAVHKGTGAQGMYFHSEGFGW